MAYIGNKPANKAVVASDLDPAVITGQTALAVSPADTDEFLISDAGTIKRIDASFFQNTPSFSARMSGAQTLSNETYTKVDFDTENFDTDGAYDPSTNQRFTVPSGKGGKYYISASVRADASWGATSYFNVSVFLGSTGDNGLFVANQINAGIGNSAAVSGVMALSAGDTITMRIRHNEGGTEGLQAGRYCTVFSGYKIIE